MTGALLLALLAQIGAPGERAALDSAARRYEAIAAAEDWKVLRPGSILEAGSRGAEVAALRDRLRVEGYPLANGDTIAQFDTALEQAVLRFQRLHGLREDGRVGPATLAALNVPASVRVAQIRANLARLDSAGPELGARYLRVNIPAFSIELIERDRAIWRSRVIVGRTDWPTPVLSTRIAALTFSPAWIIPKSIAIEEILPAQRRDPTYLERAGIRVYADSAGGTELPASTIDWDALTPATFAYQLVQPPGPQNPLGGVKFFMATPFAVFLHDTPTRALFDQWPGTLSHGCIRLEHPEWLVQYLLPAWPSDSIVAAMAGQTERAVELPDPIRIHLIYRTAWTEADGAVAFREDWYGLDRPPSGPSTGPNRAGFRWRSGG
ncbi:MAG: L,D-transpeptidase family protein [Gemmatimonadales bacterium]|nr:L,D-transpeptidase family protein [Gemmatimonadales bacterium]